MAKPTTDIDLSGFGLERIQHIGRGQYATAQLVKNVQTGNQYVAKCISLAALNEHDQDLANQEVFLLQTLNHPYIVGYRDSFLIEHHNALVIVMEYCDAGDLRKAIKEKAKTGDHFREQDIMTWFVQLCMALQYIHSEKVLHRDLKTSNIFLSGGGSEIKLGDFGISRVLEGTTEAAVTIVGTPYYMSPEVCRSEPYNWKSDIWALGCVLYELCMLQHAFQSTSLLGLVYKIVSDHYEPIPSFYSAELNDLIHQLLLKNADSRPSINEVFAIPYVKAHLHRQAVPSPPPPPSEPPPQLNSNGRRSTSLRDRGSPTVRPPPPPSPVAPTAPLEPHSRVLIIVARMRRRLVGQKLNWISSCAPFDADGDGALTAEELEAALGSMHLGLSQAEISLLASTLAPQPGATISLDVLGGYLQQVPPEVQQYEAWVRHMLSPAGGSRLREALGARDTQRIGTLAPDVFEAALGALVPNLAAPQLELLVLLADKNFLGDVDYAEFANTFGAPLPPPAPPSNGPAAPPGMPPLPGGPATPVPPGMPPLPVSSPSGLPSAMPDLAGTLTMGQIQLERTFFTCASQQMQGVAEAGTRVTLSPQGCLLVLSRLRRRLEAAGLPVCAALALFTESGRSDITAEQWLDASSRLPLGTSRAEMQQLFTKLDSEDTGRIPVAVLESYVARASASECTAAPSWISVAMKRGLCARVRDELCRLGGPVSGSSLARESDFRRVVMATERYLTSDQLNSLILICDKSASGYVDYEDFAQRFGDDGTSALPPRVPGGLLPATTTLSVGTVAASEEEVAVVASRVAAVLERHGLAPERIPALLALWGENLSNDEAAALLATVPLGLSREEACAQLRATGTVSAFAARLVELRGQGLWGARCEWVAARVPGPALRTVLQRQVCEADSRTLEPAEFMRLLLDAGVAAENAQPAMWLAEKTAQGNIYVAEFLELCSGPLPERKKKRGLLSRIGWR